MKYLKNSTTINKTYSGQTILPNEYYLIPLEDENNFSENSILISDISNGKIIVSKTDDGLEDISDINDAIDFLKNNIPPKINISEAPASLAFSTNILKDGRKLYRRKHGIRKNCLANADTIMDMIVPYSYCKIDEVEIIGCDSTDVVDFQVMDSENGIIQQSMGVAAEFITPFLLLNQFGFDVNVSDMYYSDSSNYEADLVGGMLVRMIYKNKTSQDKMIGANFVLHEAK